MEEKKDVLILANLTQSETLACISDNKKESIFSEMRRDKAFVVYFVTHNTY